MSSNLKRRKFRNVAKLLSVLASAPVGLNLVSVQTNAERVTFENAADKDQEAKTNLTDLEDDTLQSLLEYCVWTVDPTKNASTNAGEGDNDGILKAYVAKLEGEWNRNVAWVNGNVKPTAKLTCSPLATVKSYQDVVNWRTVQQSLTNQVGQPQTIDGVNLDAMPNHAQSLVYHKGDGHWVVMDDSYHDAYKLALAYAAINYTPERGSKIPDLAYRKWSADSESLALAPATMPEDATLFARGPGLGGYYKRPNNAKATVVSSLRGEGADADGGFGPNKNATIYVNRAQSEPTDAAMALKQVLKNVEVVAEGVSNALTGKSLAGLTEADITAIQNEKIDGAKRLVQAIRAAILKMVCDKLGVKVNEAGEEAAKKFSTNAKLTTALGLFAQNDPVLRNFGINADGTFANAAGQIIVDCASGKNLMAGDINAVKAELVALLGCLNRVKSDVFLKANAEDDFKAKSEAELAKWAEGQQYYNDLLNKGIAAGVGTEQTAAKNAITNVLKQNGGQTTWEAPIGPYHDALERLKQQRDTDVANAKQQGKTEGEAAGQATGEAAGIAKEQENHLLGSKGKELGAFGGVAAGFLGLGALAGKLLLGGSTPGAGMKDSMLKNTNKNGPADTNKAGKIANTPTVTNKNTIKA